MLNLSRRNFLKQLGRVPAGLSLLPFVKLEDVDLTLKESPASCHFGDPCIYCGIEHNNVPVGECEDYPNVRDISVSYWDLGEDGTFYKNER